MEMLQGHGRPSKYTKGLRNQYYKDVDTGDIYICKLSNEYSTIHHAPVGGYLWTLVVDNDERVDGAVSATAGSHKVYVTDGEGKPHWEDKLAYEASTEEVILPDTVVTDAMYKQTWVPCPNASNVKIGDTGTFYIDGKACPFEAVAGTNNYGPPADVKLYVKNHGLTTQMGYMIGFVGDQLMIYNVWLTNPGQSKTISITKNSRTLKTFDTDLMGKNAEANKVLVTDENGEATWSDSLPEGVGKPGVIYLPEFMGATSYKAYKDTGLTEQMTYAEAKELLLGGAFILLNASGATSYYTPLRITLNEDAKTIEFTIHIPMSVYVCTMTFSDTPASASE